jgi:hypothetical protein
MKRELSNLRQYNMATNPMEIRPEKEWTGEGQEQL